SLTGSMFAGEIAVHRTTHILLLINCVIQIYNAMYGSPLHSPRRGWTLPLAVAGRIPGASGPMSSSRNSMIVSLRSRIGLATLAALLLIAVAWTCSRSGEPVADDAQAEDMLQEGMLQIALNGDIRSTNPGVNRDANTDTV